MNTTDTEPAAVYFSSLTVENVKCFKSEQTIALSDGNGKPAMWTVILGDNNTGKTTLLRCLADLEPSLGSMQEFNQDGKEIFEYSPRCTSDFSAQETYKVDSTVYSQTFTGQWEYHKSKEEYWGTASLAYELANIPIDKLLIYGYGTSRRMSRSSLSETENQDNTASLFDDRIELANTEEWLLQTDYATKSNNPKIRQSATLRLEKIRTILCNGLLPDVQGFRCTSTETNGKIQNFVEFQTDYAWLRLRDLGYGYQSIAAWLIDLAKKMFERYPDSDNPLHKPAVVLVDEIDLHLHPEWQRKIIQFLSDQFPQTQFIVTAHSPLIVQSADNINLVLLKKQDDHIVIQQRPDIKSFKGWTVEEILTELMGLDNRVSSDDYLALIADFDDALDNDNYAKAKTAYDALVKILHPNSHQPKLLRLQMSSLTPDEL
ncbi:MAG: AAA family ATPase [Methyloprofundus sp.]|nr:AAA family ATPase [Methyloprofundus sp.]